MALSIAAFLALIYLIAAIYFTMAGGQVPVIAIAIALLLAIALAGTYWPDAAALLPDYAPGAQ